MGGLFQGQGFVVFIVTHSGCLLTAIVRERGAAFQEPSDRGDPGAPSCHPYAIPGELWARKAEPAPLEPGPHPSPGLGLEDCLPGGDQAQADGHIGDRPGCCWVRLSAPSWRKWGCRQEGAVASDISGLPRMK